MNMIKIKIDHHSTIPYYKQIIREIKLLIEKKVYLPGDRLPSMNHLYKELEISKETVKKSYEILRNEGLIDSTHGIGFFVTENQNKSLRILMLFDILSPYKKELYSSFIENMPDKTEFTIRLFNQDIELFEKFINDNLGEFDYYVITPHLPLVPAIQKRVIQALKKIPNRQLVLLDRHLEDLPGNYISIYQDFESDAYNGLEQALPELKSYNKLNIFITKGSLYGHLVLKGIEEFAKKHSIHINVSNEVIAHDIVTGEAYLILSGQLENELIKVAQLAKKQKLKIGKDIGLLSYNESALNEIILNGLSVLSTDFKQMGSLAAQYINEGKHEKTKCNFKFIKRNTF